MDTQEIIQKLTPIFRTTFGVEDLELTRELTANEVAGWDSLAHINLIVAVEKGFGITLTTREIRKLENVGDLIDVIQKKAP